MNNVLTVLVAGHRPDRLPYGESGDRLFQRLDKLLALLRDVAVDEQSTLRVLTGVAHGTDEAAALIAERLELPLHLFAAGQPKPLASSQQRAERIVWLGASADLHGDESLAIRDEMALCFADVLVVVWDGESPHGLSGGTVRLAFQAAMVMKPVVWLATDGTVRMLDRSRLRSSILHKLSCPHPESAWLHACFTAVIDELEWKQRLAEVVHLVFDPSTAINKNDARRLADYRAETTPHNDPIRAGHVDKAMMALARFDFALMSKLLPASKPAAYWGPAKAGENHPISPTPLIDARFEYSDVEASIAAGRHRDSTWLIYGASAMAVFSAVAGAIGLWSGGHNAFWSVAELMLISMIFGSFAMARKLRWHEKWVSHRFVAEQLRYARMCLPLLGLPRPFMEPVWQVEGDTLRLASAELWFMQRTLVTEGLPSSSDGEAYVASAEEIKSRLATYVHGVVEDQMAYHKRNHDKLHAVHERMHKLEKWLFAATAIAVLAHFVIHASWLLICTAFFPALAAAVHGLATKLEIARTAGQSAATGRKLADIAVAIGEAGNQPGWEGWIRLRQLALEASRIMSDENGQWQQLISHQEAGLP